MKTIHAVYENGVFRPIEKVELPDHCEVEFEPRIIPPKDEHADTIAQSVDPSVLAVYEVLSRRYKSGHHDTAECHDEHQP